jgi:hypothetical protein
MGVKLGLAFYGGEPDPAALGGGPVLTDDNLVFARQLGVTHIIQCAPCIARTPSPRSAYAYSGGLPRAGSSSRFEPSGACMCDARAVHTHRCSGACTLPVEIEAREPARLGEGKIRRVDPKFAS